MPERSLRTNAAPAPAVVIGLDSITGLQTSRLLSERGVPVVGVVADHRHWGARTRACVDVVESALSGEDLVETLVRLGEGLDRRAVLVPCTDGGVDTVSRWRSRLEDGFALPLSPHPIVELLMRKNSFAAHALRAGFPVPRTEVLTSETDARRVADDMRYPCVLKPAGKTESWLSRTSAKGFPLQDRSELEAVYARVHTWAPELVLQEWIQGPETGLVSCNGYFGAGGDPLATFVARKIRQWPPEVGTSASGEECRDDEALELTIRLFSSLGFRGLAYLEMKRDIRTGELMIIEANVGRPTGRSAIAEAGGVELVYTAYCDAVGNSLPAARFQRYEGARWLDIRRDAQAAMVAHHRGELTAGEWWTSIRGPKAHAIWSRRDPKPFVIDVVQAARTGTRAFLAGRHRRVAAAAQDDETSAATRLAGQRT